LTAPTAATQAFPNLRTTTVARACALTTIMIMIVITITVQPRLLFVDL
jgi:hypothetical protein